MAWCTDRRHPLALTLPQPVAAPPLRIRVDTDAACDEGRHADPDDCLALWHRARYPAVEIIGPSTVFGAVTDGAPVLYCAGWDNHD